MDPTSPAVDGPPPVPHNSDVEVQSAAFDADVEEIAAARRWVADALQRHGWGQSDLEVVELLVSEIVTNAIRHANSSFVVTAWVDGLASVAVTDAEPAAVPAVVERPPGEGGMGLRLVASLANQWGVHSGDDGKSVWFMYDPERR